MSMCRRRNERRRRPEKRNTDATKIKVVLQRKFSSGSTRIPGAYRIKYTAYNIFKKAGCGSYRLIIMKKWRRKRKYLRSSGRWLGKQRLIKLWWFLLTCRVKAKENKMNRSTFYNHYNVSTTKTSNIHPLSCARLSLGALTVKRPRLQILAERERGIERENVCESGTLRENEPRAKVAFSQVKRRMPAGPVNGGKQRLYGGRRWHSRVTQCYVYAYLTRPVHFTGQ